MPKGGARTGAGRKTKAEELKTATLAREAIIKLYGGLNEGLQSLLQSGEASLIKFVFEHAVGKSPDKLDLTGNLNNKTILTIVRGKSNTE